MSPYTTPSRTPRRSEPPRLAPWPLAPMLVAALLTLSGFARAQEPAAPAVLFEDDSAEQEYYVVDHFTPPPGVVLEVGGIDFLADGRMLLSTRRGQVWIVENALAFDPGEARFQLFAEGLHEGLGLSVVQETGPDGAPRESILVLQRGELTRLQDTDGDGRADLQQTLCNDWGLSSNYHEFAFGLPTDAQGNAYLGLNVGFLSETWWLGRALEPYRGWVLSVDPAGRLTPIASGFRSPCGLGFNAAGDLFVTDNQGDWMPAGPIHHVQPGRFYGHPASLDWTDDYRANRAKASLTYPPERERAPAAVWLPYKWSRSAGNLVADASGGAFGPFEDQLFVAELTNGLVLRTQLEQVRGEYQGACFLFRQRIGSVARVHFAPDGSLFCGMTNRGWGGRPPNDGLARIRWTGVTPMEMHRVHLLQDGFEITFTHPVTSERDPTPADVDLIQYDYDYWWEYGSPERHTTRIEVTDVSLSADRRSLTIRTAGLTPAMVARAELSGIRAEDGSPLLHAEFAYTINQLPEGPLTREHVAKAVPPPPPKLTGEEGWLRLSYGDAFDAWESEGWELVGTAVSPDNPTRLETWDGVDALVADVRTSSDYVGRYPLGDGTYHVEFMLPEGGAAVTYLQGRYGVHLSDDAATGAAPPTGTIIPAGAEARAPAFDAYNGPGVWHSLDVEFEAPRFDEAGRKTRNARFAEIRLDDVVLHEDVSLPGPDDIAPWTDESALAPWIVRPVERQVALRTFMFRAARDAPSEAATGAADGSDDEGWVRIFNGSDLDGWTLSPDAPPGEPDDDPDAPPQLGGWTVEDGVLVGTGDRSHLFSPRGDYTDLEFRARVKIHDGGNSGMYFRVTYGPGWPAGYEAQVNANFSDPQKSGSLYALAPVQVQLVPAGTWFRQHVTCRDTADGAHVTIRINGVVVSDFVDAERRYASGHVALQQHHEGSVVEYKDIEVRDLSR